MAEAPEALAATAALQSACRLLVPLQYGPEPYLLRMALRFPPSMPDFEDFGPDGSVTLELAPLALMPYSVLTFLDMVTLRLWHTSSWDRSLVQQPLALAQNLHTT
jgi:hypothetical protein